ncbi:MAG: prefoldin subunit alpha [Candidatus Aenigmarchaeota archaeon]|nr:prefoldin subunit alpha [Candidatus Aenigmarchaeota archaeon]
MDEKDLQNALVMYQLLQNQFEQLQRQAAFLQNRYTELEATRQSLEAAESMAAAGEILLPLGSGVFMHGSGQAKEPLLMDIGAGILVKKTQKEATALVEKQKSEVEQQSAKLSQELMAVASHINQLGSQLQAAMNPPEKK